MWVVLLFLHIILKLGSWFYSFCIFGLIWTICHFYLELSPFLVMYFRTIWFFHFLRIFLLLWLFWIVFCIFLGKTILKNSSSQLFVFGMFSFSMCDNVLSRSLPNLVMNFAISSGRCSIWFFNMLYLNFAFLNVFWLNISDILSL